jgi:tetratricopeptide (TPR) repeat protein
VAAYRFGALFLPDINPEGAVRFVERAIRDNPNEWRLYQDLGYIFWKQGRFREASEAYGRGSRVPGAPAWMQTMPAVMLAKGGDRETAREMFQRIYENTDDNFVRQIALARLQGFRAQDEIDFLNRLMVAYRERRGACPVSLSGFIKSLPASAVDQLTTAGLRFDSSGAPLDPEGFAYDYNAATCAVTISEKSTVARWKF